jgi:thioredoxin 2
MSYTTIRECAACGARNRVPARYLARVGKCGVCGGVLGALAAPLDVGEAEFYEIIGAVDVPVLVDFWAEWCGPCRMAGPEVKKVAAEMAGRAVVLKVDTEAEPGLGARQGVRSIPNFQVFVKGRVVFERAGVAPAGEMRRWIELAGGS